LRHLVAAYTYTNINQLLFVEFRHALGTSTIINSESVRIYAWIHVLLHKEFQKQIKKGREDPAF
jgi:hypothetical protein